MCGPAPSTLPDSAWCHPTCGDVGPLPAGSISMTSTTQLPVARWNVSPASSRCFLSRYRFSVARQVENPPCCWVI